MGKKVVPVLALLMMILPMASFALGLGPITMRSALNQPLLAEIDVHSIQPGDLEGLAIKLASEEDFKRNNIDRQSFLTRIKFSVDYRSDGSAFIKLTSDKPITEPYIDFIIEARWPRGRQLREYTVLVDPPVLTAEAPAPVQQSVTAPVFSQPKAPAPRRNRPNTSLQTPPAVLKRNQEAPKATARMPVPEPDFSSVPEGSLNHGKVQRGETLSEIAQSLRTKADVPVSVQQMMLALLKSNPSAFIEGNVNQLKAGYVLRIEDASLLEELTQSEAVREVRRQTQEWRARRGDGRLVRQADASETLDDEGGSNREARSRASAPAETTSAEDNNAQLKLVAPGREGLGVSGAGEDSPAAQQLKEELALASEALEANRVESSEMKSRLSDLEEQLTSMQRLIMLKDEEMLTLQNQVKNQQDGQDISSPTAQEQQKIEDMVEQSPVADEPKPTSVQPDEGGFFSDTLMLIVAVLLVIGMVVALVIRRRKMQQGFEESILNVGMSATVGASAAAVSTPMSRPLESGIVSDFAMSDMSGIQSDTTEVDPISEADVYLAYGRHQQAEDILKQAIDSDPQRLELRAKLLEVYHGAGNRPAFETEAQTLYELVGRDDSNALWARVASLGAAICPDNPIFGGMGAADEQTILQPSFNSMGAVSEDEEDLLDFEFEESEPTEIITSQGAEADDDDDNLLDFDVNSLDFNFDEDFQDSAMANIDAMDKTDDHSIDFNMPSSQTKNKKEEEKMLSLDSGELNLDSIDFDTSLSEDQDDSFGLEFEDDADHSSAQKHALSLSLVDDDGQEEDDTHVLGAFDSDVGEAEIGEDIFANVDEIGTKLDLAKAYVDMGDSDGARSILDEVIEEGDDSQKQQAEELLQQMG